MGWFNRRKERTVEADNPLGTRLELVASRLETVTDQLEQKLAEMRANKEDEDQ